LLSLLAAKVLRGQSIGRSSSSNSEMLVDYFARRLASRAEEMKAERSAVRGTSQVQKRNHAVRTKLQQMLGPAFAKCPLAPRQTAVLERGHYRIENVLFQSRPDFWVPANVYVPANSPGPFPAVTIQRGHFNAERMSPDYQQLYVDLVENGFVVLTFDPIGQGERRQHYKSEEETLDEALSPTLEHCAIGGLLLLIGESAAGHFAWDGIRAIDYLASRSDVSANRIGVADHTDTGWNSAFLCALDRRVKAAALHIHGSARRWPLDPLSWNLIDDPEQQLFPAAKLGVDQLDILAAIAPAPLLALFEDQTNDFEPAAIYLRNCYNFLHTPQRFAIERAKPSRPWPRDLRLASVRWLKKWLSAGEGPAAEAEITPERYSSLRVTPTSGQQALGQPIYGYVSNVVSQLGPGNPPSLADLTKLRTDLQKVIGPRYARASFGAVETYSQLLGTFRISRLEFTSESGIRIPAILYRPLQEASSCFVYAAGDVTSVGEDFDDDDDSPEPDAENPLYAFARKMVDRSVTVLAVDVRGIGLTRPAAPRRDYRGKYEHMHNSDVAIANMAWSLGESLFAMRVKDVLRAVEFASQYGRVHLVGLDMAALWALVAAALDPGIVSVSLQGGLASFRMLAEHGRFLHSPSQFIPGMLKSMDLPQIAALIAPRRLSILSSVDHMMVALNPDDARMTYEWTRVVYQLYGADLNFRIGEDKNLADAVDG
jgi:pimeloyl-ACP methyl ester carboxylesterase